MEVRILGPLEVVADGEPVPLGPPQQRAVLGVLALARGQVVAADRIIDALWTDRPATAANLVQGYVSGLRKALAGANGDGLIRTEPPGYRLDIAATATDAGRMEALVAEARTHGPERASRLLTDALALWRGSLLADSDVAWRFAPERVAYLDGLRRSAREERVDAYLATGRHGEVLADLEALVIEDPTQERTWEQLMVALYRSGRQADALRAFSRARTYLADEVGVEPGPALRALERAILDHDATLSLPGPLATRHNLPLALTSFVGRDADHAQAVDLLASTRFVTLVGAGGVGKTRLALEIAATHVNRQSDGVWFVDLTPLREAPHVVPAVGAALGARGADAPRTMPALIEYLRGRDALIVLDNCEHLLDASADVALGVLAGCERIRILATSREPLDVPGETVQRVPPLAVPDRDSAVALERCAAVELFVERAEASGGGPSVRVEAAAESVAEVCRRLDGLPLAIELAAARTGGMSVDAILPALDKHLGVLDRATGATRHRSLNATLHWSHDLLTEPEQRTLARLSVFSAGFTLPAAGAVAIDGELQSVVTDVGRLVDKSLVVREEISGHDARYRLLETVRQFAGERLVERGEVESTRQRHAWYFATLSQEAGMHSFGPSAGAESPAWHDRLAVDHDNITSALQWCADSGQAELGAGIVRGAWWSWFVRGRLSEGAELVERARSGDLLADTLECELRFAAACFALTVGRFETAVAMAEQSIAVGKAHGDDSIIAMALASRASCEWATGKYDTARSTFEEAAARARSAGDLWQAVAALAQLGRVMIDQNDLDAADRTLAEAEGMARAIGEPMTIALVLDFRGLLAEVRGQHDEANRLLSESLDHYRRVGYEEGVASALAKLCRVAEARGAWAESLARCAAALDVCDRVGSKGGVASALEAFGSLSVALANEEQGVRLMAGAARLRDEINAPVPASDRSRHDRVLGSLKRALGDATFDQAWVEGSCAPLNALLEQARVMAIDVPIGSSNVPTPSSRS